MLRRNRSNVFSRRVTAVLMWIYSFATMQQDNEPVPLFNVRGKFSEVQITAFSRPARARKAANFHLR